MGYERVRLLVDLFNFSYGLPAAIGAKLASPDKIVVDIDGDASFCMTAMELATAAQFNIGIKVRIIFIIILTAQGFTP